MNAGKRGVLCVVIGVVVCSTMLLVCLGALRAEMMPNESYRDWMYDSDLNRIDDRLETPSIHAPGDSVDAVVLFNRCLQPEDTTFVASFAQIDYVGQYVHGIWVRKAEVSALLGMLGHPHGDEYIFRIERSDSVYASLSLSARAVKARQSEAYGDNYAWSKYDGQDVVIAVLDTGVDDKHPALDGKLVAGYYSCNGWRLEMDPDDDNIGKFHGTHVAGTALGLDTAGTYIGIAPGAKLVDVKVLNSSGRGTTANIIAAIDWCIENRKEHGIRILNLSLGTGERCDGKCSFCMAVDKAVDAGLVVCCAAGNDTASGWAQSPAAADRCIAVGAIDNSRTVDRSDDVLFIPSNCGPRDSDGDDDVLDEEKPDVAAPGVSITAPKGKHPGQNPGNIYHSMSGTSMACPHVAGLAAILLQQQPDLTPEAVKVKLRRTSRDAGQTPNPAWDPCWGKGMIDAWDAIWAPDSADIWFDCLSIWPDPLIYTPEMPPFAGSATTLSAIVSNAGPNDADSVVVVFYTNAPTMGYPGWKRIGETMIDIPSLGSDTAQVTWTPLSGHQCIKAEAIYFADGDLGNNAWSVNFDPRQSSFSIEAGTPFPGEQMFTMEMEPSGLTLWGGWSATVYSKDGLFDSVSFNDHYDAARVIDFFVRGDKCPEIVYVDINHPWDAPSDSSRLLLTGYAEGGAIMVGQQIDMSYVPLRTWLHDTVHDSIGGYNALFDAYNPDTVSRYSGPPYNVPLPKRYQFNFQVVDTVRLQEVCLYGSIDGGETWVYNTMTLDEPFYSHEPALGGRLYSTFYPSDFGLSRWDKGTNVWYYVKSEDVLGGMTYFPPQADPVHQEHTGQREDYYTFSVLPLFPPDYTGAKILLVDGFERREYEWSPCLSKLDSLVPLEAIYEQVLVDAGYCYDIYDINDASRPTQIHPIWFDNYDAVLWFTGSYISKHLFNRNAQEALRDYLGNGGKVILCGDRIAYNMGALYADSLGGEFLGGVMGSIYKEEMEPPASKPFVYLGGVSQVNVYGSPVNIGLDTTVVYRDYPYRKDMSYITANPSPPAGYTAQPLLEVLNPDPGAAPADGATYIEYLGTGQCVYVNFDLAAMVNNSTTYCDGMTPVEAFDFVEGEYEGRVELVRTILEDLFGLPSGGPGSGGTADVINGPVYCWSLAQSRPNPCVASAQIRFEVARRSPVSIEVYNVMGQVVRTLVRETLEPGRYSVRWDATNDAGKRVSPGVYFYRMYAQDFSQSRKMIILD